MANSVEIPSALETDKFCSCDRCGSTIDLFHEWSWNHVGQIRVCLNCTPVDEPGVNPLPEHLHAKVEPYIQWREAQAIGRFVLEQAEMIGNGLRT